jgi:hypothetical protein
MTVTYQPDGRIRVDNPHDALLLSLAGVELFEDSGSLWQFYDGKHQDAELFYSGWFVFLSPASVGESFANINLPLCVPAEVAKDLVSLYHYGPEWEGVDIKRVEELGDAALIEHNNRWHVLPDIKKGNDNV